MDTSTTMRPLAARLVTEGFTPTQIARLVALREAYPLIELVESRRELNQLRFLRWQHANGRLDV